MNKEEYDDLESYIQVELLGHCMCGSPLESLRLYHKVLGLLGKWEEEFILPRKIITREDTQTFCDKLDSYFYNDEGLKYTFFYMLDKYEFIEHGGSVTAGWLDTKGEELLKELNELFKDDK